MSKKEISKKPTTKTAVKRPVGRPRKPAKFSGQYKQEADKALALQATSHKASVKAKKAAAKRKAVKKLEASVKGKVARRPDELGASTLYKTRTVKRTEVLGDVSQTTETTTQEPVSAPLSKLSWLPFGLGRFF